MVINCFVSRPLLGRALTWTLTVSLLQHTSLTYKLLHFLLTMYNVTRLLHSYIFVTTDFYTVTILTQDRLEDGRMAKDKSMTGLQV